MASCRNRNAQFDRLPVIVPLESDSMSEPIAVPAASQSENHSVVRAAGVIGIATFSSRILGFIRDMVLARLFGATPAADAFFVSMRFPNLFRSLFAEGAFNAAFVPQYARRLEGEGRESARRYGLGLGIGGLPVTLEGLVRAYAVLAATAASRSSVSGTARRSPSRGVFSRRRPPGRSPSSSPTRSPASRPSTAWARSSIPSRWR